MEENIELKNVEEIITELKKLTTKVKQFRKFDGITIECDTGGLYNRDNAISETVALCKQIKAIPVASEKRQDDDNLFAIQFPEMMPVYPEELIDKFYTDDFKFLLDNVKMKDPTLINKTYLVEQMDVFVKHAMKIVCRSTINQYKDSFDNYYNNKKYRLRINAVYLDYVDVYLSGGIINN